MSSRGGGRGGVGREARGGGWSGRGRGRKPLNNGNYFGAKGQEIGKDQSDGAATSKVKAGQDDDPVLEEALGFATFTQGQSKLGWLMNLNETTVDDKDSGQVVSAVNCYFMCQDGSMFKSQSQFSPYLYLHVKDNMDREVDSYLRRKYESSIRDIEVVHKEDLDLKNHLSGLQQQLLKVIFWNSQQLTEVKREMQPIIRRNKNKSNLTDAYKAFGPQRSNNAVKLQDSLDAVVEMKEHDVPYHIRFCIDEGVRCGHWFNVSAKSGSVTMEHRPDLLQRAEPRICAFDIETTKLPLQFPNAEYDQVFMISYMVDRQGYLIVNREVVSEDINDFEYTPKPEFEGPFIVWNEPNEAALLKRWFDHMREVKPGVYVTYNGDFFDWPFIETRASKNGMDMKQEVGFAMTKDNQCLSRFAVHMDCMHWVNRDSYLPQGSRGLKAVTKAKLGYDPVEVHPEDMIRFAAEQPHKMASYSVSDAVATYYLYMTYIHPFIFSLSTIIPMPPDEVLRKGSGTLCEVLLMVQAYVANIVCPNKHTAQTETMYKGHLLESETYIGGKVEALESGVFRSDLPMRFKCKPEAYQALIDKLDSDLQYAITVECKASVEDVANYEEVRDEIKAQLESLRDVPNREECPLIYHLDVAAMYPNIILTNRLQPSAVVTDEQCAACDFNKPGKTCLRSMEWVWRGEHYSATSAEYNSIKAQLASESFPPAVAGGPVRFYQDLSYEDRSKMLKDRLKKYSQKVYKRVLDKPTCEVRQASVCMRENDFYVGTVRAFRDRRYEYKGLNKKWKGKLDEAKESGDMIQVQQAADMVVLYDSLQLAHKCILNSFYGYVMRKGARWYSMQMAGVVTYAGAQIIQRAARLVEQLGTPLELDTDGIWCCLPSSFPENFKFETKQGKDLKISYPCVMLNVMVAENNTNDQYATLVDPATRQYKTSNEMSIEFEVDGPYKAMVLPASKEEGKLIKKRYAVFNFDGSLAELKGFELKRRGELKLIKVFQSEVFERFLLGDSLEECYDAVAEVANRWLDMLDTQGVDLSHDELLSFISESCTMSKALDEDEGRKSCAITTARRLAQFLGDERIKDKGLNCNYVIARRPDNLPTSDRAIPVAIFSTEPLVARTYLRKWCGDISGGRHAEDAPDVRELVDWAYYKERLGSAIQKIITIPAAMQRIPNPVPRVKHPDWLHKKVREKNDKFQQRRLDGFFKAGVKACDEACEAEGPEQPATMEVMAMEVEMEDMGVGATTMPGVPRLARALSKAPSQHNTEHTGVESAENAGDVRNIPAGPSSQEPAEACPDRHEDPAAWIKHQKRRWQAGVQERKRRKLEAAKAAGKPPDPSRAPKGSGAAGFFRQQAAAATHTHWQLIQLAGTSTPGTFKAWVLVNKQVYAVPLRVPRTLYVNSSLAPENPIAVALGRRVIRTLPYGQEPFNVYQVVMPDAEYREQANELAIALSEPHVKGVFEERLPLDLHAALQLGCVTAVIPESRSKSMQDGFDLTDLQMRTTTECSYLAGSGPEGMGPLQHVGLFQSHDSSRGRAVYVLALPMEQRAVLIMVSPAASAAKEVTASSAEKSWREAATQAAAAAESAGSSQPPQGSTQLQFEVVYVPSTADACKAVQRALTELRQRHRGPVVIVTQAAGGAQRLHHDMPGLADFPCCDIPARAADSKYPPLQWQQRAAKVAVHRVAAHGSWLQERVQLARYCHLPIGNMTGDWIQNTADALYARCLRDADHLLWANDPSLPDVAGPANAQVDTSRFQLDQPTMEVVYPGAYRCVCVQIKLHHMAVNATAQAGVIGELEGAALLDSSLDPQGAGPAFKVLKQLVSNWLHDAVQNHNSYADALLRNLWRWLCSPSAVLASPAIRQSVASLMRKVLAHLVAEMRKLGATIVAADMTSIILATGKRNLTAAVGYVDYLLDALRRRELFMWLELQPTTFWHTLLFRDWHNFLGIQAALPADLKDQLTQAPGTLSQGLNADEAEQGIGALDEEMLQRPAIDQLWNIKDYLPPAMHEAFLAITTEFVVLPWRHAMQSALEGASQGGSQALADARSAEQMQVDWLRDQMAPHFTQKLLRCTRDILKWIGAHDSDSKHQFPILAGSHLPEDELGAPALAFVRTVCAVLALDLALQQEVAVLRRNLLKLVHVREFASASEFKEPCMSYVLRDVICPSCNDCRDLDLCRDPHLQVHRWNCGACETGYELGAIESALVAVVQQQERAYQLQDLQCTKCKNVSSGHLARQCKHCGGELKCAQPADVFRKQLTVFKNIARYHSFQLLMEIVEWLLEEPGIHQ
ncbi:TPA: hypothetical protein ACH3X2_006902 [Trebouxia sp. C0005]